MVAKKEEIIRLWVDSQGWRDCSSSESGFWEKSALHELQLLINSTSSKDVSVHLSPEFFLFYASDYNPSVSPLDQIQNELGVTPEHWLTTFHILDETIQFLCIQRSTSDELDKLLVSTTKKVTLFLVPVNIAGRKGFKYPLPHQTLYVEQENSTLKHWNLLSIEHPLLDTTDAIAWESFSKICTSANWHTFEGPQYLKYKKMKKYRQLLTKALVILIPLSLLFWGYWLIERTRLLEDIQASNTFLIEHQDEVEEVQLLDNSQREIWSQLKELQSYSNHTHPLSNFISLIGNEAGADIKWDTLMLKENKFVLTISARKLEDVLTYFDRLKEIAPSTTFEEIKSKKTEIRVKFEGGIQ